MSGWSFPQGITGAFKAPDSVRGPSTLPEPERSDAAADLQAAAKSITTPAIKCPNPTCISEYSSLPPNGRCDTCDAIIPGTGAG